jgi:hypothetical protein
VYSTVSLQVWPFKTLGLLRIPHTSVLQSVPFAHRLYILCFVRLCQSDVSTCISLERHCNGGTVPSLWGGNWKWVLKPGSQAHEAGMLCTRPRQCVKTGSEKDFIKKWDGEYNGLTGVHSVLTKVSHCIVARNSDCVNMLLISSLQETQIVFTSCSVRRCKKPRLC